MSIKTVVLNADGRQFIIDAWDALQSRIFMALEPSVYTKVS
jgi:hypothetical protein